MKGTILDRQRHWRVFFWKLRRVRRREWILRLYREQRSMTVSQIAARFGITKSSTRGIIERHAGGFRRHPEKAVKNTPCRSEWERTDAEITARRMYREGCQVSSIAHAIGYNERTVYRWLKSTYRGERRFTPIGPDRQDRIEKALLEGRSFAFIQRTIAPGAHSVDLKKLAVRLGVSVRRPGEYRPSDRAPGAYRFNYGKDPASRYEYR